MSDLVERLRKYEPTYDIYDEAAERIAELEAEAEDFEYSASQIIASRDKRIAELEAELERYRRIVPGTPATESEWVALVARAEAAERKLARVEKLPPNLFANDECYRTYRAALDSK